MKRRDKKKGIYQNDILENWKIVWEERNGDGYIKGLVSEIFETVMEKEEYNKRWNTRFKKIFLWIHIIAILVAVLTEICFIRKGYSWSKIFGFLAFYIVIAVWGSAVVSKWIDIKKYQETWARHSRHHHEMEREMLLFCYGLPPYERLKNAKEIFINNMLRIWSDNQERFNVNMETKEKKLTEDFMEHIIALPKIKKQKS